MPAVLGYTWLAYRVFRGKVHHAEGYSGHAERARQLLWFAALWCGGVAVLALVSTALRTLLL